MRNTKANLHTILANKCKLEVQFKERNLVFNSPNNSNSQLFCDILYVTTMIRTITFLFTILMTSSCSNDDINQPHLEDGSFISAVDLSSYPEIKLSNPIFYDTDGIQKDIISILKSKGINTIRLRLWVNPKNEHSGFNEVKHFSEFLKSSGLKIWLTLHYSDTWADPSHQHQPSNWQGISYNALKDSVYNYTKKVATQINPSYIQIGNEINSGFLHPHGNLSKNRSQFKELLQKGILVISEHSDSTKIILHYAGLENADWFFGNLSMLDYDIIGISYYPIWHGKSLAYLKSVMSNLSQSYYKDVVIAETAYPFTLYWNDWTNNIIGEESQLILPDFPATPIGQKNFVKNIRKITKEVPNLRGIGFCYWGADLIAWKDSQATNGSPWENQALFDFQNTALQAFEAFHD